MIWVGVVVIILALVFLGVVGFVVYIPSLNHQEQLGIFQGTSKVQPCSIMQLYLKSLSSDFCILIIPMYLVVGLRMPLGRKVGVYGIFLTGLKSVPNF